jgi:SPP1 gp7 family putative phage head morphogenesis protein
VSVNDAIRDRLIRRDVWLDRYADSTVRKILGLLAISERDIEAQIRARFAWIADRGYDASDFTLRRLEANLREVRRVLRDAYVAAGRELRADLVALAKDETEATVRAIGGALPAAIEARLSLLRLSGPLLRAIVESRPFQGALLRDWARQLEVAAYTKLRGAIRQGLAQAETIDQIVRRVRGTRKNRYRDGILALTRREAETIVRTSVSHVAQAVREDTYQANSDLVRSIVWLSTLDMRTTSQCQIRDGREYTLDHRPIGHAIPWGAGPGRLHFQCRSASTPRLKSWRELGFDVNELDAGTRASMNGQVPAATTFGSWITRQPADVQDEVLGKRRAAALRSGTPFGELFDTRGRLRPAA